MGVKSTKKFGIIAIILVVILASCGFILFKVSESSENISSTSVEWRSHYDTVEEMAEDADVIILGKVVSTYTEERYDIVFTRDVIKVTSVISGDVQVGDSIEVLQTGGEHDGKTTSVPSDLPLLKKKKEYAMFLELTDPNEQYGQYYLVMGGYQGIAKVTRKGFESLADKNDEFVESFDEIF
jgi:hypothetical protein